MNLTSEYTLTVIVPVFNEEDNIEMLEQKLSGFLSHAKVPSCVLFVDDGSYDSSYPNLCKVCDRNKDFFFIKFLRNCGLSAAIKAGIDYAESPLIGYIDADLQTDPEQFNDLLAYADQYDLVIGYRESRNDSFSKRIQSKIANSIRRSLTGDTAIDTGCPLKIMKAEIAKKLPFFKGMHRFIPALFALENGTVYQLPVRHFPRQKGVSKFSLKNRLWSPFMDCFAYRWMRKRYIKYDVVSSSFI